MNIYRKPGLLSLLLAAVVSLTMTKAVANPAFGYKLETDVIFAQGKVISDGAEIERDLMLDV